MIRVGVMGAGAVGCYAGGLLCASGACDEVIFVGRERLRAEVTASGLTLTDLDGGTKRVEPAKIRFETDPQALAQCDLVLVASKSAQTAEIGATLAKIIRKDAIVISLQNGVRNPKTLRESLPNVLGGIVAFNVVSLKNGLFRRATSGPLVIEASPDPRVTELARAFESQGLEMHLVREIEPLQWTKLIINLNNAISALSDLPTAKLLFDGAYRRILSATMAESISVLTAAKIPLKRIGPLPVRAFPVILKLPTPIFRAVARAQLKIDPEARSSMWEDLAAGRQTEVDYLNGEIVRVAEEHRLPAPLNRGIVELVHEVEAKKAGSPKLSAEALWSKITPPQA